MLCERIKFFFECVWTNGGIDERKGRMRDDTVDDIFNKCPERRNADTSGDADDPRDMVGSMELAERTVHDERITSLQLEQSFLEFAVFLFDDRADTNNTFLRR